MLNYKLNFMKLLSRLLLAAFILPMAFVGCSDDDDDDNSNSSSSNNNQNPSEQFVYDVDGDSKDVLDSVFVVQAGGILAFSAEESGDYPKGSIMITFPDTLSAGTYNLGGSSNVTMTYDKKSSPSTSTNYSPLSGSLTLLTNNPTAGNFEGSFNFTAIYVFTQDTVRITNGQFNLTDR